MRNLIGRLNARTPTELEKIAEVWRIPSVRGDKLARVAALYRAMTTHWVPACCGTASSGRARGGHGADGRRATGRLAQEPRPHARAGGHRSAATATALYRAGILARDGDDDHLPIGEEPRLFVPRELIQELTQVRDERARGDVGDRPLREHLDTWTTASSEEAGRALGRQRHRRATARETARPPDPGRHRDPRRRDQVVKEPPQAARELLGPRPRARLDRRPSHWRPPVALPAARRS
jgi:hypothetical protein